MTAEGKNDALYAVRGAALEIIAGQEGPFTRMMEVYGAGHYPFLWDGQTLVVF